MASRACAVRYRREPLLRSMLLMALDAHRLLQVDAGMPWRTMATVACFIGNRMLLIAGSYHPLPRAPSLFVASAAIISERRMHACDRGRLKRRIASQKI